MILLAAVPRRWRRGLLGRAGRCRPAVIAGLCRARLAGVAVGLNSCWMARGQEALAGRPYGGFASPVTGRCGPGQRGSFRPGACAAHKARGASCRAQVVGRTSCLCRKPGSRQGKQRLQNAIAPVRRRRSRQAAGWGRDGGGAAAPSARRASQGKQPRPGAWGGSGCKRLTTNGMAGMGQPAQDGRTAADPDPDALRPREDSLLSGEEISSSRPPGASAGTGRLAGLRRQD